MKICLTMMDDRWVGVVSINQELFKAIFIPGSATKDWVAILQPTLFVELESPQLIQAIEKAKEELDHPQSPPPHTNKYEIPPEVFAQIESILKEEEDGSTNPI